MSIDYHSMSQEDCSLCGEEATSSGETGMPLCDWCFSDLYDWCLLCGMERPDPDDDKGCKCPHPWFNDSWLDTQVEDFIS